MMTPLDVGGNGNINPTFSETSIVTNADSVREITVADMDNDEIWIFSLPQK